jgi:Protein of unknown function (DUF2752)
MSAEQNPSRRRHRDMLLICCAVIVLSFLLQVRSDERVVVPLLSSHPLPPACMSQTLFGVSCPGCGLTRSFIHLAHGDWRGSWHTHRLGWLLAMAVVMQIPYRLAAMRLDKDKPLGRFLPWAFSLTLIVLLFANWILQRFGI